MPDLPSSLPDTNNLVEITWENGQIVMQPQSDSKPPKTTGDYVVNDLANTDVSWLTNYPSTDDYCIDILSPLTGNNTNTNNTNSPLLHDDDDDDDGGGGGGGGGDAETSDHAISISNPNKLFPTQDPTSTCRFLNFSNFTRPVTLHKTNLQKAEKLKTPNPIDNTSVVKWDEKSIIQSSKEKKVSGCLPEKLPSEMVAASSSLCSSNRIKRTITEGDESCYQSEDLDDESADCAKKPATRSSSSNKRSRTAEVHNLSERRRRDRINEKMKALQELIPNCNKVDKASMLDEAIEYLKTLQFQLQMMSTMGNGGGRSLYMPSTNMMMQPRMPHFPQMGVEMAGMGMFDVSGRPPMMRLPFHYPSSSIPVGQYQSNAVPMVGHPVSSIAHGSSYFPLPTHTTATAAATRMNFGPEVGVNTPATWMMNENSETRQKSVKLGDNDDLQKCG